MDRRESGRHKSRTEDELAGKNERERGREREKGVEDVAPRLLLGSPTS